MTERSRAEIRLRESEEWPRRMVEYAADLLSRHTPEGVCLYASPACQALLGYEPEELLGLSAEELLHPDDLVAIRQVAVPVPDRPDVATLAYRIRRKDGRYVWFETTAHTIRDPRTGRVREIYASSRDVTARRRAEEAQRFLAEASDILASSLDYETTLQQVARLAVPTLADWCTVYVLAEDGEIRRVATAYADEAKAELAQALHRYRPSPVSPRSRVAEAMRTGRPVLTPVIPEDYIEMIAQDAEHLEIMRRLAFHSALAVPLCARGDVLGALALYAANVGHEYDAADLALAEELARRAGLAVDNARLHREVEQHARLDGALLAARTAQHVLNNQLARTTGYADLLANDPDLPARLRALAEKALRGAEAAAETVNELRHITHLEETDYGGPGGTVIDLARSTRRPRARARGPHRSKDRAQDQPPV